MKGISKSALAFASISTITLIAAPPALAAGEEAPGAGGAPVSDIFWGTLAGAILTVLAIGLGHAHRTRRFTGLERLGRFSSRMSGLPPWAALPAAVTGASLELALFGFWWDVATHIGAGRDEGAFGNVAHWPILLGLGGIALGGFLAVVLAASEREPTAVRLGPGWYAPLGGLMILGSGTFALSGFPLDDTWHRLFGQDVTLWGPTHVLMIASASLATLGVWTLLVEGRRWAERVAEEAAGDPAGAASTERAGDPAGAPSTERAGEPAGVPVPVGASARRLATAANTFFVRMRAPSIAGGFLIALSSLQGEFDFGVPQFSLLLHPVMLAVAASVGLVTARIVLGPGGALKAVAFYLVVRALMTTLVGPVFGLSTQHFPLYAVEALLVEAAALALGANRPLRLGAVAGALIGTVGFAAEWGWSHVWMPISWPESILPEAALFAFAAAVAGGVVGAFIGGSLAHPRPPQQIGPAWAAAAAAAVLALCVALPIPKGSVDPAVAQVQLEEVRGGAERSAHATVRIEPASAAEDAYWLTATAWQGGGLVVDPLRRVAPGVYRTTRPIPLHGEWKSLIRLARGRSLDAVPVSLPADPAIPAAAVPARAEMTRTFVSDKSILQREAKTEGGALSIAAYLVLGLIMVAELAGFAWALRRLRLAPERAPRKARRGGRPAGGARRRRRAPSPSVAGG